MHIKSLIILGCYLLCYYPASYFILRYFGVREKLHERALIFGVSVGGLLLLPPVLFLFVSFDFGAAVGLWLGVVLAYLYINKVLNIRFYQNIGILIGLPLVSGILSLPVMYLLQLLGL